MTGFELVRRQVAIGGLVLREGEPLMAMVEAAADAPEDVRRCLSRADGSFFFLDLPDGEYAVGISGAAPATKQKAVVQRNAGGDLAMAWIVLEAPPG